MNVAEVGVGAALVIFISTTFLFSSPPQTIANDEALPTKTDFHFTRKEDQVDATAQIKHLPSGDELTLHVYHGELSVPKGTIEEGKFSVKVTHDRYLNDLYFHVNTFAGYWHNHGSESRFQVGLGLSPGTFLYGTVSPNFLITKDAIGGGLALYAPAEYFPSMLRPFFSRTGIEVGRLYSTHNHGSGNLIGLSIDSFDF